MRQSLKYHLIVTENKVDDTQDNFLVVCGRLHSTQKGGFAKTRPSALPISSNPNLSQGNMSTQHLGS